jgi:hypothetical protein
VAEQPPQLLKPTVGLVDLTHVMWLSLLKNLFGLGIGLPMKIGRIEHWPLLRPRHHAWVLGAVASERLSCKTERPPTPKRVSLFGRHNSLRGATFVAMMQTPDLRKGNDLARGWPVNWTGLRAILVEREMRSGLVRRKESSEARAERIVIMPTTVWPQVAEL